MYRIFIVEDDAIIARSVKNHLSAWDYEVHCVEDFSKVMQEFAEGTLALTPFFRHDEDECQHRCGNTENYRDDQENHLLQQYYFYSNCY